MALHGLAALLASMLFQSTVSALVDEAQCTCYDTYSNFHALANDQYKNALADRLRRERLDSTRAALQQIQTEMLQGRDPESNAEMATASHFTCQVCIGEPGKCRVFSRSSLLSCRKYTSSWITPRIQLTVECQG